jgi:hypothetical protein
MDNLEELRVDLANRSKWNIGYFVAGALYWLFATITGTLLPMQSAKVYWLIGTFLIFPVAVLLSRALKADPFTKGNTLGSLVGWTHVGMIYMLFPLIVVFFLYLPDALPLAMAICYGASFIVFFWAFGATIFLWHTVIRVVGATLIWFALPGHRYSLLPGFVAALYLATCLVIPVQRQAWLRVHTAI